MDLTNIDASVFENIRALAIALELDGIGSLLKQQRI